MPTFRERIQNFWRNDFERQQTELESEAKQAGRNEIAQQFTGKLAGQAQELRDDWIAAAKLPNPGPLDVLDVYYQGRIETYNEVAYVIHQMDNDGSISIETLPELLHAEGIREGVHRAAAALAYERVGQRPGVDIRKGNLAEQPASPFESRAAARLLVAKPITDFNAAEREQQQAGVKALHEEQSHESAGGEQRRVAPVGLTESERHKGQSYAYSNNRRSDVPIDLVFPSRRDASEYVAQRWETTGGVARGDRDYLVGVQLDPATRLIFRAGVYGGLRYQGTERQAPEVVVDAPPESAAARYHGDDDTSDRQQRDQMPKVQTQRRNQREVSQEEGMGMSV